LKVIYTKQ